MTRILVLAALVLFSAGCIVHTSVGDFDCEPTIVGAGHADFGAPACTRVK
jgi:hypothetical protein